MICKYKAALKAGLISWLASSLIAVALLLPYLSNLNSFAHSHSSDTAKHVHSLQLFIQGSILARGFLLTIALVFICFLVLSYSQIITAVIFNYKKSRAPPILILKLLWI